MSHHVQLNRLLSSNAQWAEEVTRAEPRFFEQSAQGQAPHTLWIGCSDSRVPDTVITGARPGEIFVHRNIANQLRLDDDSALSVLAYAVDHLGVEHIVIVGHSECGGAAACLAAAQSTSLSAEEPITTIPSISPTAPLNRWLAPLTKLAASLELSTTPKKEALPIVVEENVKRQVENLCQTETIIDAWASGDPKRKDVWVHGWVYDLASGRLKDLEISRGPHKLRQGLAT